MEHSQVVVTLAVIERAGSVLMAQRLADSAFEPSRWGFPGGKVEFGEHPEDALIREIQEELGVVISIDRQLCSTAHTYERAGQKLHAILLFYKATIVSDDEPQALVEQAIEWVPKDLVKLRDMVEGNIPVIDICLQV